MRRSYVYVGIVVAVGIVLPAAYYYYSKPTVGDQLDNTLRAMGFFPINPPNNLISLGSLYHVDSNVQFFRTVCFVDENDIAKSIRKSPSTRTVANELYSGSFKVSGGLSGAGGVSGSGALNEKFLNQVKYSLSEVQLYEVDLSTNRKIMQKLMMQQECRDAVADVFSAGGYVCQGQTIFEASAVFDLNVEAANKADAKAEVSMEAVRDAVKTAVKAQSDVELLERSGKLVTGSALKYGVAMSPTCLAPSSARFARILPKTAAGRIWNFVKFNMLEPILPASKGG